MTKDKKVGAWDNKSTGALTLREVTAIAFPGIFSPGGMVAEYNRRKAAAK